MAYNKAKAEKEWLRWKEAEEKKSSYCYFLYFKNCLLSDS